MTKYIFFAMSILVFSQCTKKAADVVATPSIDKAWRGKAPGAAPARDIQLGTYSDFELPNGLKVIVVENHKLPRISYQISFNNDALVEGDKAGYTSFAGDLLSKGTATKSKSQIDESIDYIGASLNTSASGVFGSSLKKHSDKLLTIMTDVLYNPTFPKEEFEKIRKRSASNLLSAKTDPNAIAGNIKNIVNFGANHPYGEVQSEETIKNITLDDCKKYVNTYFKPNNAYLVIVGDITPAEAKSQVDKYFTSWKRGDIPTFSYAKPKTTEGAQVRFGNKDGAVQSVIDISYPVDFKPGNPDAIKASLMNSILGGGIFSGRLMQNLREKKAYTYGARSNISTDKLVGNFSANASVRNEVTDSSVVEFLYELNRIVAEPVAEADLSLAKSSMGGNFGRSLESPQTIANFALNTFRYNLPKDYYNNYLKNIDVVTIKDIQDMASKYITPNNCNIVVVGNKDNVADKLKRFDSDGKLDFYDAFGKKIEDAKIEIGAGVTSQSVLGDYIEAIGGKAKLAAVRNIKNIMKTSIMGQDATIETYKDASGKFAMKVNAMNMVVQEQRFDGQKGLKGQMGQNKVVTEAKDIAEMQKDAILFDQLEYMKPTYKLELKSIENIEGNNCYKVIITEPTGDIKTEFYDVKSGLLSRSVSSQKAQGKEVTISTDYMDYKLVDGVMMPHKTIISGAMPTAMTMESTTLELNKVIDPAVFKVE